MSRIIIVDSCAELNEEMIKQNNVRKADFHIDLDGKHFLANDEVNIDEFLDMMKNSKEVVRTAAPSPDAFYELAKGHDEIYFITISSRLSGSYNSAVIAKRMLEEENPNVKIHVFDSKSASNGETQIIRNIQNQFNLGKKFEEIVAFAEEKLAKMQTLFVLEDLDNLIKNGRMSKVAGFVASALSIYPIGIAVDGKIDVKHKPRGIKNAVNKLVDTIGEIADNLEDRVLYITHIRNMERAETIKNKALEKYNFKNIEIFEGSALSTTYANRNGIIITF